MGIKTGSVWFCTCLPMWSAPQKCIWRHLPTLGSILRLGIGPVHASWLVVLWNRKDLLESSCSSSSVFVCWLVPDLVPQVWLLLWPPRLPAQFLTAAYGRWMQDTCLYAKTVGIPTWLKATSGWSAWGLWQTLRGFWAYQISALDPVKSCSYFCP